MSLGAGAPLPSGRVTLLLTDVEGSTAAWDNDPVAMDAQMERHDAFVAVTVGAHGGLLLKSKGEGDSTFSVFDDPASAVAAALEVIRGLPAANFALPVRAAVHTGEVVPRAGDYFGPVPNRAARLRGLASGGQVLLSSSVASAITDRLPASAEVVALGTHQLRGLAEPEDVFALAHPDLPAIAPLVVVRPPSNLPAPVDAFVGRDDDRTALEKALGRHRLVTIVGPGGVGKTRLALETAADQAHALPGGTWFVDVGPLTSAHELASAVVAALGAELEPGADPAQRIADALQGPAILVLDTCEAHLDAAAELADQLMHARAELNVLATSRQALGVQGEAVLRLEPLRLGGHHED
nr:adenylate/guanylate cyclase domain-containing protein [Actinomycetota bacterium]